jgi:hypothetical protein
VTPPGTSAGHLEVFDGSSIDEVVATTTQQWHPGRQEGGGVNSFLGGQIWKFEIFTFQFEAFFV